MSKTIAVILSMNDKMSPKLFKVSKNVKGMSKDMQRASKNAVNMANKFSKSADKMVKKAGAFVKTGAKMAAAAGAAGGVALVKQSDTYAGIQARLKLINDGQQTVEEFNQKIFKSADKARANYQEVADIVGKLGITAGDAFESNDEILRFSELMSKSFKVGGASAQEQSAAMYQLTQAMAAGKLQGDEFRSISENAPLLAKAIANEMGVSMGELKEMSSEGKITSDVIKAALFNSSEEINKQFSEMPMTFGDAMKKIKNGLMQKLKPSFEKLSTWLNSEKGEAAIAKIGDAVAKLAEKIPSIIDALKKVYDFAKKVFDFVIKYQDIFIFVGTFIGTLMGIVVGVSKLNKVVGTFKTVAAGVSGVMKLSTFGVVGIVIAALVAVGILLWKNWDTIKEKATELWSKISEVFGSIRDFVVGVFEAVKGKASELWGKISETFENIRGKVVGVVDAIKEKVDSIKTKFSEVWESIKTSFENFKTSITDKFTSFIDGIKEKWEGLKEFLKHPITGTVNLIKTGNIKGETAGKNALGTSYWRGGLTQINERGGEIVDLPNGSRVIPADKSARLLSNSNSNNIVININGVNKSTSEIMSELMPQLKLKLANI